MCTCASVTRSFTVPLHADDSDEVEQAEEDASGGSDEEEEEEAEEDSDEENGACVLSLKRELPVWCVILRALSSIATSSCILFSTWHELAWMHSSCCCFYRLKLVTACFHFKGFPHVE